LDIIEIHLALRRLGVAPVLTGADQADIVLGDHTQTRAVPDQRWFFARRHLVGLREWNAIAHAAPIGVLLHFAAHALGDDGNAFGAAERRKQRFIAGDAGPQHLDEAANALATLAGPGLARRCKPSVEASDIVPIGDQHDIREPGLIDIMRAIPMRGTIGTGQPRGDLGKRARRNRWRIAVILQAEIGHHDMADRRLVTGHEGRIRRTIIVRNAPVARARGYQVRRNGCFHGTLPYAAWPGRIGTTSGSGSTGPTLSTGSANGSTRLKGFLLRRSRVTSGRE